MGANPEPGIFAQEATESAETEDGAGMSGVNPDLRLRFRDSAL